MGTVVYIKDAAGIVAGTEKNLPDGLANALVAKGIAEHKDARPEKEPKPKLEKPKK